MSAQLALSVFGALLLVEKGLTEKGAFEKILDVNFGKGQIVFTQFCTVVYFDCL